MDLDQMKTQLLKMGVDPKLLDYIGKIPTEAQRGLFELFREIVEDELLFVLALTDMTLSDEYQLQKKLQPSVAN